MIYFTAHTFNCVCHCIRVMFRVLGMYNFDKCTNLHDFGKFNINHINLILLVSLQINGVYLYVSANERII